MSHVTITERESAAIGIGEYDKTMPDADVCNIFLCNDHNENDEYNNDDAS